MSATIRLACLVAITCSISAEIHGQTFGLRVRVTVSTSDDIGGQVSSFVNRELRSLGDVVVADTEPMFKGRIVVEEVSAGGREIGYAMSTVVTRRFSPSTIATVERSRRETRRLITH